VNTIHKLEVPVDREKLGRFFDTTRRVVIVSGGTPGIGRALAEGCVCAGTKVVFADGGVLLR
jgi:predicted Rossmann-fold nucleotide-binding protein